MKYGLLVFKKELKRSNEGLHNVGDNIQALAMYIFYLNIMHINPDEIVEIDYHDLSSYRGEQVLLPINFYFPGLRDAKETWFPTSNDIVPIFIGLHLETQFLENKDVEYLKCHEPIGCRDEYTYSTMVRYGIDAYIGGCITTTLEQRKPSENQNKVFIVDVDRAIVEQLPEEYKDKIEYRTHEMVAPFDKKSYIEMSNMAKILLEDYKDNAKIVITSRLHCAAPCIAMGIPVVLVVKEKKSTFTWIDNIIPIYTDKEIDKIDWNDLSVNDFTNIKPFVIDCMKTRIEQRSLSKTEKSRLTTYFSAEKHKDYVTVSEKVINSIEKVLDKNKGCTYAIWGATSLAEQIYQYLLSRHKNVTLKFFVDEYNSVDFHGIKSNKYIECELESIDFLICTPAHARPAIESLLINSGFKGTIIWSDGKIDIKN